MQRAGLRAVVLGAALTAALSGCTTVVTGHATTEPRSIQAGHCYQTENPQMLSPGNLVDCGADHVVEVLAVRRLPADLAAHERRDLISTLSGPSDLLEPHAREVCDDVLLTSSGLADALVLPEDPAERRALDVTPLASTSSFVTVPQEAFWSEGERTVVCGVAYSDKLGAPETFAWPGDEPMFTTFATGEFRSDLRWCERYPEDPADPGWPGVIVGCDDPHDWEGILEFEAGSVLDATMLLPPEAAQQIPDLFRLLTQECESLAPDLLSWGLAGSEVTGSPGLDWGTPRTDGGEPEHRAACGVLSPVDQLIVGSVFDEGVRLVPR